MAARELFVDTGAWLALTAEDDAFHEDARQIYPNLLRRYRRLITTNLVVAETYILLRRAAGHAPAVSFLEMLERSPRIEKVYSTARDEIEAYRLLKKYDDQDFSFADAVSFVIMRRRKIQEVFAFDQHFHTAGYRLVL
ncbi:type II toxin-antitoxin system VapC family toxin [Candidatus Acetothermia bacterium]|nr:type II toxin-antitoxin system VapC family toxin [Candidatus Acetothermia bacterium]MBI3460312.1 type II toxin-antitoxin system VapC family toxin [Candidatus Acetothermia bacterium]MBI3660978.1 type II toxin-antitoxin system VapC family toxin [Candidatus Acetothermia bacterium]